MKKTVIVLLSTLLILGLTASPVFADNYIGWDTIRPLLEDGEGSEFVQPIPGLASDRFSAGTEFEAVQAAASWVATYMSYEADIGENWTSSDQQYAEINPEMEGSGTGDCEDYAILLCALLRFHTQGGIPADRVWVIYEKTFVV